MDLPASNAAVLSLVFLLGAAAGALLNSVYRASRIEKIKAEFVRQLEEKVAARETRNTNQAGPSWWSESSAVYSKAPMSAHSRSGEKQVS